MSTHLLNTNTKHLKLTKAEKEPTPTATSELVERNIYKKKKIHGSKTSTIMKIALPRP